jgi:cytochrome c peroxidase
MKKNFMFISVVSVIFLAGIAIAGPNQLINLGGALYRDLNLSLNQNQSCMTCHHNGAGFADTENRVDPVLSPVSDGSVTTPVPLFGGRNAPTAAYAGFSPIFHWNEEEELFFGGLFWDGRATGMLEVTATGGLGSGATGDPLADQAKGPFGNPVEMALPLVENGQGELSPEAAVVAIIQASEYADLFEKVFGPNAFADIGVAYNNASIAIAAFERSSNINKFSSKFDKFVAEQGGDVSTFGVVCPDGEDPVECEEGDFRVYVGPGEDFKSKAFSYDEADGLAIFNSDSYTQMFGTLPEQAPGPNGGMCYLCHLTENHVVVDDPATRPLNGPAPGTYNPILTDFSYDNLGIPVNPQITTLAGPQPTDYGLGAQVAQLNEAYGDDYPEAELEKGKFRVSSLRNLSLTAPYSHNGFFATIADIVHFYNTRDVLDECPPTLGLEDIVGITCWPVPEVPETVNGDELGRLGLTPEQEQKLVLFLETLSD